MRTGVRTFKPRHMKLSYLQIYIAQLERAKLTDPQTIPVRQKQNGVIALRVA
jgi:hypothetical protein